MRYLHRRMLLWLGDPLKPAPIDHVHGCTTSGNAYPHLDTGTNDTARAVRAALAASIARPGAAAAEDTLLQALRAFALQMAVGPDRTFRRWRDWAAARGVPPAAGGCIYPLTDADLVSFREYTLLRDDPKTPGGDPAVPAEGEPFFTNACAHAASYRPV